MQVYSLVHCNQEHVPWICSRISRSDTANVVTICMLAMWDLVSIHSNLQDSEINSSCILAKHRQYCTGGWSQPWLLFLFFSKERGTGSTAQHTGFMLDEPWTGIFFFIHTVNWNSNICTKGSVWNQKHNLEGKQVKTRKKNCKFSSIHLLLHWGHLHYICSKKSMSLSLQTSKNKGNFWFHDDYVLMKTNRRRGKVKRVSSDDPGLKAMSFKQVLVLRSQEILVLALTHCLHDHGGRPLDRLLGQSQNAWSP